MAIERVLVVDSEEANVLFFDMLFREFGYDTVHTSTNGVEGLEIVGTNHIQFIVVAWELTGSMNGTLFIQKAREKRKRKHLPCLIYSKRMTEEEVTLTKELGFKDILSMPFDKAKAREAIKEILDREADLHPVEVKLRKIESLMEDDKLKEALIMINPRLFSSGPHQTRAYTVVAELYSRMGKHEKMEEYINKALKIDPEYYQAHQLYAKFLSQQGKHDEAIELLQKMSSKSPKNLTTKIGLGTAYIGAERLEEAKAVFEDVMKVDEECQGAKDGLATVAVANGDIPLALQLVAETESGNEMARTFNNMAIGHVNKGEFDVGIQTYKNAITVLSDKAKLSRLHFNLGLAWKKKGDLINSFEELHKCYSLEPSFEKAYLWLAKISKEMKAKGNQIDKEAIENIKAIRKQQKAEEDSQKSA